MAKSSSRLYFTAKACTGDSQEVEEKQQQRRRQRRQKQAHSQVMDYDDEDYEVDDEDDEEEESNVALGGQGSDGHIGMTSGCAGGEAIVFCGNGARSSSTAIDADGADAAAIATEVGLLPALDARLTRVDRDSPNGKEFHLGDELGGVGGEGSVASCDGGTSVGSSAGGGMAGLFQQPSFSGSEGDVIGEDEEEDEDGGGWGQVIVRPVKVARWDELGQRSKSYLSLNQLRALIIERAESIPQKATYRRAAKLVRQQEDQEHSCPFYFDAPCSLCSGSCRYLFTPPDPNFLYYIVYRS